jgi:hypothetical protein
MSVALRAFIDQVRLNPRFAAKCAANPNLEQSIAKDRIFLRPAGARDQTNFYSTAGADRTDHRKRWLVEGKVRLHSAGNS